MYCATFASIVTSRTRHALHVTDPKTIVLAPLAGTRVLLTLWFRLDVKTTPRRRGGWRGGG